MSADSPRPQKGSADDSAAPQSSGKRTDDRYRSTVLGIQTPVAVRLASKSISVKELLTLVPGALIQFNTPCDAPLTLEAGGQPIATGEAVKVDDKFGLRIQSVGDTPKKR